MKLLVRVVMIMVVAATFGGLSFVEATNMTTANAVCSTHCITVGGAILSSAVPTASRILGLLLGLIPAVVGLILVLATPLTVGYRWNLATLPPLRLYRLNMTYTGYLR